MQRLPYNGAPRAHKLRHNVISSSLFNERWQHAAHTFYPGVLAVGLISLSLPFSLSLFLSFSRCSLRCPTIVLPKNLLRAMRCVVLSSRGLKRNPPTYRAEPSRAEPRRAARPYSNSSFHGSRYHFLGANALPALPIIISLLRVRARDMHHSYDCRICIHTLRLRIDLSQCIHSRFMDIDSYGLSRSSILSYKKLNTAYICENQLISKLARIQWLEML